MEKQSLQQKARETLELYKEVLVSRCNEETRRMLLETCIEVELQNFIVIEEIITEEFDINTIFPFNLRQLISQLLKDSKENDEFEACLIALYTTLGVPNLILLKDYAGRIRPFSDVGDIVKLLSSLSPSKRG